MRATQGSSAGGTRSDAVANREKLLTAAAATVKAWGEKVPMSQIAEQAGVGIGTLYRHFPSREKLLSAVTQRSLKMVLQRAQDAAADGGTAIESIERFFEQTIRHRGDLILPLHGGPLVLDAETQALKKLIREALEEVLARGLEDGSVREDVTATDIIITGALLAQPLPHTSNWDQLARRRAKVLLAGLSAIHESRLPALASPASAGDHCAAPGKSQVHGAVHGANPP